MMVYRKQENGSVAFVVFCDGPAYDPELHHMGSGVVSHVDMSGCQRNHNNRVAYVLAATFYLTSKSWT